MTRTANAVAQTANTVFTPFHLKSVHEKMLIRQYLLVAMKKIRIAIVDDSEIFRKTLRTLLDRESDFFVVAEGESGLDAVGIADEELPDIILMDVNMPLMNGLAATRVICANFPETRVIMLSMHADEGIIDKAMEFGAHCFLTKVCRPIDVVEAIRAACPANQGDFPPPTNSAPIRKLTL